MSEAIVENLINELTRLPGIGRKTAQRLAFYILGMPPAEAAALASAITDVKEKAGFCRECFNITSGDTCRICASPARDRSRICVVEDPGDIMVVERMGSFNGLYHVLMGALSPMDGITPERLKIDELFKRAAGGGITEVIIATNPNTKGEMTARYIAERMKSAGVTGVQVTRIAYGLPMGGNIEFADEVTLGKSFEGRRAL